VIWPALDPPLLPSPDEARGDLRRELLNPDYHGENPIERLLDWLSRSLDGGVQRAQGQSALTWFLLTVLVVLLVAAVALALSRVRGSAQQAAASTPLLGEEQVTAADLRRRAEDALAAQRFEDAVVDGYRALALRQVERGRIEDTPGLTAHEAARLLADVFPEHASALAEVAWDFDAIRYGDQAASREQAVRVLGIDDSLLGVR